MDIMLTVSYSLTIPREKFFYPDEDPRHGYPREEIKARLEELFPKKIMLAKDISAQREHLTHCPLYENGNALRCAACGKWLYMPGREDLPAHLERCTPVKGVSLCPSCAWELERDIRGQ